MRFGFRHEKTALLNDQAVSRYYIYRINFLVLLTLTDTRK